MIARINMSFKIVYLKVTGIKVIRAAIGTICIGDSCYSVSDSARTAMVANRTSNVWQFCITAYAIYIDGTRVANFTSSVYLID